ncbi:MAG: indole-3-glycerol phosphate synthase TrpC [Bacteroidales bacterium]|nr:indole-3-glycerol phosphate synthase TrpC [Bacteroidales bacterium]
MNYLEKIVARKREIVAELKRTQPISMLERQLGDAPKALPFAQSIRRRNGIIAEFKRQSPSKGLIHTGNITPKDVVPQYEQAGVSAISCLTDTDFFGGTLADLREAVASVNIPVLRKDFVIDEYQIVEARANGASAILLIAAILTRDEVKRFASLAKSLGMEVLLELHGEDETDYVTDGVTVAGINNRDLRTFEVDIERSIRVSHLLPNEMPRISESGIRTIDEMIHLRSEGFDGFLIGETFMKSENPGATCIDFCNKYSIAWKNAVK